MFNKGTFPSGLPLTMGLILALAFKPSQCDPQPGAKHVCTRTDPIRKDIVIDQPVQYEIKVQSMCGLVPCVKTRYETRMDEKIKTILQQVERRICCAGYTETPDGQCAPNCPESCQNGAKCVAFNTCECQPKPTDSSPGFAGPTCERFVCLEANKWGPECDRPCDCPEDFYCSADTGNCLCHAGSSRANCSANIVTARQKAEPLVFDDYVKPSEDYDFRSMAAPYLVGLLSIVCLVFLVAFLIIKKKYNQIRDDLYYSTGTYPTSNYSESPSYASAGQTDSGVTPSNGNLAKNFSFAATTRNTIFGKDMGLPGRQSGERNRMVLHPRVESHLILSQKEAEKNIYTDLGSSTQLVASKLPRSAASSSYAPSEDHIYQVPRSISPSVCARTDISYTSADSSFRPHETTSHNQTFEEDSTSNIYEEITPRK